MNINTFCRAVVMDVEKRYRRVQGAVSQKPRKLFGPVKPLQNLAPCDYRAVLYAHSKDEGMFPSNKKFQAYTVLRFKIQMIYRWLYGPENFPGLSKQAPGYKTLCCRQKKKTIARVTYLGFSFQEICPLRVRFH